MTDNVWTARSASSEVARTEIGKLSLTKSADGRFNHDDATIYGKGVRRALLGMLKPGDPNGMAGLLDGPTSELGKIKSTDSVTWKQVIADEAARAQTILVNGLPVAPDITDRADAIDEANRINANNQAVIGAKIGATEAIVAAVGTAVANSVLRLPDGTDTKGVDAYQLKDLLEALMLGASRPLIHDIIKQLNDVINFKFNFQQRIDTNVELLRTMLAKTHSYGIALDDTIVALVIIHNVTCAQNETWGAEFRPVLQSLRQKYTYNHVHDGTSVADMLKVLAGVDGVRDMRAAPVHADTDNAFGAANAVDDAGIDAITRLTEMLSKAGPSLLGSTVDIESAAAATFDSDSSRGRSRSRSRKEKDKRDDKGKRGDRHDRSKSRGRKGDADWRDNPCKWCRENQRTSVHKGISEDKCMWNPHYKGFRFFSVCERMGKKFKPQKEFEPEDGGLERARD